GVLNPPKLLSALTMYDGFVYKVPKPESSRKFVKVNRRDKSRSWCFACDRTSDANNNNSKSEHLNVMRRLYLERPLRSPMIWEHNLAEYYNTHIFPFTDKLWSIDTIKEHFEEHQLDMEIHQMNTQLHLQQVYQEAHRIGQ